MSRSGYSDECENLHLYRQSVSRAIEGRRGQALLRDMVDALDAMPVKELAAHVFVEPGVGSCALGVVADGRDLGSVVLATLNDQADEPEIIGRAMDIAESLAAEVAFENDERVESYYDHGQRKWLGGETDAERWTRMRAWAESNIIAEPEPAGPRS